jgi:hypothetical protein
MKTIPLMLCVSLSLALAATAAPVLHASGSKAPGPHHAPQSQGLLPVPANRIVGTWQMRATVGPCQGGPTQTFSALNTFHAGGTLSDINVLPPSARVSGQGIWELQRNGQYRTRFQFFRFLPDGSFDGVQDIRTTIVLDHRATRLSMTIQARVLNTDGSVRAQLCGSGSGERLGFD